MITLLTDDPLNPDVSYVDSTSINSLIFFSLTTQKGTLFQRPDVGSLLHTRTKKTSDILGLVKKDTEDALKWLKTTGKALSIIVTTTFAFNDPDRINIIVRAIQADRRETTFTHFVIVK